jgi:hypothetical protein
MSGREGYTPFSQGSTCSSNVILAADQICGWLRWVIGVWKENRAFFKGFDSASHY